MSYGVQDRIFIQLRVNGENVPLDESNLLEFIHIVENVRIYVPMLTFKFKDTIQFFTKKNLLVDGATIELTIEAEKVRSVYYFRLFSCKESVDHGVVSYYVQAYLDVPRYWAESSLTILQGSVSKALQDICNFCRITYDGITTADSQVWVPNNNRYCEMARDISEHAWVSASSCCVMALTAEKEMRLVDVSKMATLDPVQYFTNKDNSKEQQVISDYKVINKSGFYNTATGYRHTKVVQSLTGTESQEYTDLTFNKNTAKLMMNDQVHSALGQSKVTFAPVDVGNVSETYERSVYQNRRLANLFCFGLNVVTPRQVRARLLETVNVELAKPGTDGIESYNGKYLLTEKVTYIVGFNLKYKLELVRHGLNTQQESTQL